MFSSVELYNFKRLFRCLPVIYVETRRVVEVAHRNRVSVDEHSQYSRFDSAADNPINSGIFHVYGPRCRSRHFVAF